MNIKVITAATLLALGLSATVYAEDTENPVVPPAAAADQGHGKITFTGTIIDAPCSINANDADQTVKLGSISNYALADGGKSTVTPFSIRLTQCDTSKFTKGVQVTFDGISANATGNFFAIQENGSKAGVVIENDGTPVKIGDATTLKNIGKGDNELKFSAYLQGLGGGVDEMKPGNFSSVANFQLSYQ